MAVMWTTNTANLKQSFYTIRSFQLVLVNLGCNRFPTFILNEVFTRWTGSVRVKFWILCEFMGFFGFVVGMERWRGYVRSLVYAWNWLFLFYFPLIWNSLSTKLTNWLVLFILSSKVLFFLNRYFLTTYVLSDQITVSIFKYIGIQYFLIF